MKINIYYGGRGLLEDPTIYVMNKLTEVLDELRVVVSRYNLYEEKNSISMLPNTLKDADGVILATTLEWMGIGGYMQQFLDACWLYGDKEKISKLYMIPVVMATTFGERETEYTLMRAWEMLGGIPFNGLCAYVDDHVEFETNPDYTVLIEKKAEQLYRIINQKAKVMPSSINAVKKNVLKSNAIPLTPQESEQLSMYVSDDTYVKKQKEDIKELTQIFRELLGESEKTKKEEKQTEEPKGEEFISSLKQNFHPLNDFTASYVIQITDTNQSLVIEVNKKHLKCFYGEKKDADVIARTKHEVMEGIVNGRMTFQRAFMSGELTAKGNFKTLRSFDTIFQFNMI